MQIIDDAKKDLEEFQNNYSKYQEKVEKLSDAMGFHGDCRLQSSYMPTYYAGDVRKENMIVIIGANPGWNDKSNVREEEVKKQNYFGFVDNFFTEFCKLGFTTEFCKLGFTSPYYEYSNRIWGLIQGLTKEQAGNREEKYNVLQNHVINIDLIPYHSKSFHNPDENNQIANDYLNARKKKLQKYIEELNKPRLLVFNSAITKNLLDLDIDESNCLSFDRKNKRPNKMYLFNYNGVRSVWFDAQLGSQANPTKNADIREAVDYILQAEQI